MEIRGSSGISDSKGEWEDIVTYLQIERSAIGWVCLIACAQILVVRGMRSGRCMIWCELTRVDHGVGSGLDPACRR